MGHEAPLGQHQLEGLAVGLLPVVGRRQGRPKGLHIRCQCLRRGKERRGKGSAEMEWGEGEGGAEEEKEKA